VLVREDDYHERYNRADKLQGGEEIEWPVPFWHVDAGAAMMLVLLAAIDEGYAAGVYGVFGATDRRLRELLSIPDDLTIVAGITVGRPLPDPELTRISSRTTQRRRTLDELVHWNAWS
jgi:FMN reductase [NAD(P)H]